MSRHLFSLFFILSVGVFSSISFAVSDTDADTFQSAQAWESLVGADSHSDIFIVAGVRWSAEQKALESCRAAGFEQCVIVTSSVAGSCRSQCTGKATARAAN